MLRLAAVLMLTAWWPLATGNVAGCVLSCRHAAMAAMHQGMMTHAAHHGPSVGKTGACAAVVPLALLAAPASAPVIAARLALPAAAPVGVSVRLTPHTLSPEPPPPRA